MGKNDLDGQLNLFGNDPYQPKKAKASEEQVELSTEAEEFLSVGRRKKKTAEEKKPVEESSQKAEPGEWKEEPQEEKAEKQKTKGEPEEKSQEPESPKKTPKQPAKPKNKNSSGTESIVMQQSFCDASGKTATVAYVDYNCIYLEEPGGKATLTQYPDAKTAVDRYLENVARLSKTSGLKKSKEHPTLRRVECKAAEEWTTP